MKPMIMKTKMNKKVKKKNNNFSIKVKGESRRRLRGGMMGIITVRLK